MPIGHFYILYGLFFILLSFAYFSIGIIGFFKLIFKSISFLELYFSL